MMQHILIGSLLYNVIITWANLQEPSIPSPGQLLSLPPPQNKNKWVQPVIFEPQPMIQLTQSSYKVTSFLEFHPFWRVSKLFINTKKILRRILITPDTFKELYIKMHQSKSLLYQMKPLSTNISAQDHVNSNPSLVLQELKIEQYSLEVQYINKVFHTTYSKFLTAIDHIDYHPSQVKNTTRTKRSEEYAVHGYCHSYTRTLTPSEEIVLDKFFNSST